MKINVAAIQCESRNGEADENLERAGKLVRRAVDQGAELVICPEFLATGYEFNRRIWKQAERDDGRTETWLRKASATYGIFIGTTYLQWDGRDFVNSFVLYGPDGNPRGRVAKSHLPFFEPYFYKSKKSDHLIETEFGKVSVGICGENHLAKFCKSLQNQGSVLHLMPHSSPIPRLFRYLTETFHRFNNNTAEAFAQALGCHTIFVNKIGKSSTSLPMLGFFNVPLEFDGQSKVMSPDGDVLAKLDREEGILVHEIDLNPVDPAATRAVRKGYWVIPLNFTTTVTTPLLWGIESFGIGYYKLSKWMHQRYIRGLNLSQASKMEEDESEADEE